MMKNIFLAIALILITGCALLTTGQLSSVELNKSIETARVKALTQLDLSESETKAVQEHQPIKWGYYILSGTYAQYYFHWDLPTGKIATVYGIGDILTQPEASVKIIKK